MTATPTPTPASRPGPAGASTDPADRLKGRLMAQSLGQLLDQARGAREVLPHLGALERSLLERGACAVNQVPPHWLGRICSQLSSLPLPEHDPPLHDLLRRLLDRLDAQREDWDVRDGFDNERTVVIREISHSEFMAASDEQATTQTMPQP